MGETQKRLKTMSGHGFSQFELTKDLLNNLQQFNITPVAKLVLLYLSSCYNPKKADMFPKQKTIADKIGVSEVSVTRAISELHKEGLIVSERKYTNRYKFTSRISSERAQNEQNNLTGGILQNDNKETIKMIGHDRKQIKRTNKQQKVSGVLNDCTTASQQDGMMLTSEQTSRHADEKFLLKYAQQRGVKNKVAYINAIKRNGGASEIVADMRQAEVNNRFMQKTVKTFIENDRENRQNAVEPTEEFKALKADLLRLCGRG